MGKLESAHSCSHRCGVQAKAETLPGSVRLGVKSFMRTEVRVF